LQLSDYPDGRYPVPSVKDLLRENLINDTTIEKCFSRPSRCIDKGFLDIRPDGAVLSVRTALKNVIANGMIIWIKHSKGQDFRLKEDAHRAIHALDSLTPAPSFVFPLSRLSASVSRRRRKVKGNNTVVIEVVRSDGEEIEGNIVV